MISWRWGRHGHEQKHDAGEHPDTGWSRSGGSTTSSEPAIGAASTEVAERLAFVG